ncbi:hypothetical protein PG984_009774 [Apiospora sp. TS-2023a]
MASTFVLSGGTNQFAQDNDNQNHDSNSNGSSGSNDNSNTLAIGLDVGIQIRKSGVAAAKTEKKTTIEGGNNRPQKNGRDGEPPFAMSRQEVHADAASRTI